MDLVLKWRGRLALKWIRPQKAWANLPRHCRALHNAIFSSPGKIIASTATMYKSRKPYKVLTKECYSVQEIPRQILALARIANFPATNHGRQVTRFGANAAPSCEPKQLPRPIWLDGVESIPWTRCLPDVRGWYPLVFLDLVGHSCVFSGPV